MYYSSTEERWLILGGMFGNGVAKAVLMRKQCKYNRMILRIPGPPEDHLTPIRSRRSYN